MQISKRDFLKKLGLGGLGVFAGGAFGDEYVPDRSRLPAGSCGDPDNAWFGKHIFPLEHTVKDGESCRMVDGKVIEPAKEIPVFHETDVVVVGGGPAGFAAAVAAARAGAKVALVERYGSLGGLFTNGMVLIVLATSAQRDGKWNLVTRGICEEFMLRAGKYGTDFSSQPLNTCPQKHWLPTIDPECAKYLMDRMVAENKIEMFFHSWGVDVIQNGDKVLGVVFESKEGRQAILAKQVVDCTGDADMLFKAGGDYKQVTCPISTVFRYANMDTINPPKGSRAHYPRRGNEGNPDARWGGGRMMTGNGLSVRDLSAGKGDMFSMPWAALLRLSVHYERGAKKYGRLNYQKGIPVSSFIDSAFRHLAKYAEGWDDEDHLAAAAFNILGALQMEETHPAMNDLQSRNGTYDFTYPKPVKDDTAFGCGPDSCGIGEEENKTGEADFQNV